MGSVYKRKDSGHWWITWNDDTGKRHRKSCRGLNQKQAGDELKRIEFAVVSGNFINPTGLTFEEHITNWLERIAFDLSPSTYEGYQSKLKNHIMPTLSAIPLDKVKTNTLQSLMTTLRKKELGPKSIRNIHGIIHSALADAVKLGLITNNPASNVSLPRVPKPEISIASDMDLAKLLAAIENSKYRIPILLAIGTGARRGEILALQWKDIGWELQTLTISRAFVQVTGKVLTKDTKSGNSRQVRLPATLVDALQLHYQHQQQQYYWTGDDNWISTKIDGSNLTPDGIDRAYQKIKETWGIKVSLHGLRHTLATEQLTAGIPDVTVSRGLGHSSPAITKAIYTHVQRQHQEEAAAVAEKLFHPNPSIKIVGKK